MGSLEFSKKLLRDAKVAVSPGIGFGDYGDDHVRFSLIENEHRTRQAVRGIKHMFREDARADGRGAAHQPIRLPIRRRAPRAERPPRHAGGNCTTAVRHPA
jgi:hypothetical protein